VLLLLPTYTAQKQLPRINVYPKIVKRVKKERKKERKKEKRRKKKVKKEIFTDMNQQRNIHRQEKESKDHRHESAKKYSRENNYRRNIAKKFFMLNRIAIRSLTFIVRNIRVQVNTVTRKIPSCKYYVSLFRKDLLKVAASDMVNPLNNGFGKSILHFFQ